MKKKYLLILATTAILALSGCTNSSNRLSADDGEPKEGEEPAEVEVVTVAPESVRLNATVFAIQPNETIQLELNIRPLAAYNAKFAFSSSDAEVASVDENGLVTGLKEGKAIITVKSADNENVSDETTIYVGEAVPTNNKNLRVALAYNEQKTKHYDKTTGKYVYPNIIKSSMDYKNSIVVDGNVKESFNLSREVLTSESDAYFSMATTADFINTFDGGTHYQNYQYQMLANPGRYDSFIFYTSDSRKNVYYANTGFMADEVDDQGNKLPLNEVVLRLLDSLFSTGRELATDNQERSLETKYLNAQKLGSVYGRNSNFLSGTYIEYSDQSFEIGTDQESSYGIPAHTPFKISLSYDFTWEEGLCRRYCVHQLMTYELNGHNYEENYEITYGLMYDDEVGLVLPNVKDYNLVTDLYDL